MASFIGEVAAGILNAFRSGDFEAAGEIAMRGLQLAFAVGQQSLMVMWDNFVNYLAHTLTDTLLNAFGKVRDLVAFVDPAVASVMSHEIKQAAFAIDRLHDAREQAQREDGHLQNMVIDRLRRDLDAKIEAASAAASALDVTPPKFNPFSASSGLSRASFGTFSAAQALALGPNQDYTEKQVLRENKMHTAILKQIAKNTGLPPGWALE